jgi:hypothetical protein
MVFLAYLYTMRKIMVFLAYGPNSAVFDNVLAIDERLRQLESEVSAMDQYYATRPLTT